VETAPDLGVLEGTQVAVDAEQHVGELVIAGHRLAEVEVAVDLGPDQQLPHLVPQRRRLARIHRRDRGVSVEELLEAG
jgi:hypothetical protein